MIMRLHFGFRALVLITLAITMQLVKVVLLTKDIAVCASLGSKVQAVRKVIPIMPNRPLARVQICNEDILMKKEYFQISMSVLEHKTAVKMLFATIPKVPITVHVNLDILEMDGLAKVNVTKALILFKEQGNGN